MPRKIKVVPVAETEIKQDPIVEIPNEPTPSEIASNQSVEVNVDPEPPKSEEVIQSEDEIKVITNKEEIIKNKAPTGTCDLCGKTMLLKNLKYAHPKVCKSKPPTPPPPPPPTPNIIIERVVVNSAPTQSAPVTTEPKTIEQQYHEQKQTKTEQRKQRIKRLNFKCILKISYVYI